MTGGPGFIPHAAAVFEETSASTAPPVETGRCCERDDGLTGRAGLVPYLWLPRRLYCESARVVLDRHVGASPPVETCRTCLCMYLGPAVRPGDDSGGRQRKRPKPKGSTGFRPSRRRRRRRELSVPKVAGPRRRQRRVWRASPQSRRLAAAG